VDLSETRKAAAGRFYVVEAALKVYSTVYFFLIVGGTL
jgi:hypothetical protein